jgi:hypothetical protein
VLDMVQYLSDVYIRPEVVGWNLKKKQLQGTRISRRSWSFCKDLARGMLCTGLVRRRPIWESDRVHPSVVRLDSDSRLEVGIAATTAVDECFAATRLAIIAPSRHDTRA